VLAAYVGEALIAALEEEGESFVVEAQQAEDGGVQVVDMDRVLNGAEPDVVG